MSLVTINWNPEKKQLRTFGTIALLAAACLFLLFYLLKGLAIQKSVIIFAVGLVIFIISRTSLKFTKMIYLGLTLVTLPIGLAVSFIVLALFYFLLLTPLGLIFRLIGRDSLGLKFNLAANSYWKKCSGSGSIERYFRQF
jgi:hypothetical protein